MWGKGLSTGVIKERQFIYNMRGSSNYVSKHILMQNKIIQLIDCFLFNAIFNVICYIAVASAPTHAFLEFFYQYSAKYSFKATGCFPI